LQMWWVRCGVVVLCCVAWCGVVRCDVCVRQRAQLFTCEMFIMCVCVCVSVCVCVCAYVCVCKY